MNDEISMELSKGEIMDRYVKKFLNRIAYKEAVEMLEFSNTLIKEVEDILFELDLNNRAEVDLLSDLQHLLDKFVNNNLSNFSMFEGRFESDSREQLLNFLSTLVSDEKQWIINNKSSNKVASIVRRCILKILNAITDFQNNQIVDIDNLIEILRREFPVNEENERNQVFLSHAYMDRVYTLGLFLYFYDKDIYLYIDWMHQAQGLITKKIKNNLLSAINNSAQLLFLRTLNSELGLQGGSRQIREWCAWEIGTFDYKSNNVSGEGFYIDRYRQNRQVKSRSQIIRDYQPLRAIKNGRLY